MPTPPLLRCDGVSLTYEDPLIVEVLQSVSLSIGEGESVAICGPSGAGKSTLLNILGLLQVPTAGEYLFEGFATSALDELSRASLRARRIGFVFQSFHLLAGRSALDNIALGMLYTHQRENARILLARPPGLSGWTTGWLIVRMSCPEASVNVWQSPGPLPHGHLCCWRMNPPAIWTVELQA